MTTLINRRVFLAATGLILAGASSAAPLTWGEHGMALFGGKAGLYASHLPMFHAPHDYQVLLQIHIADPKVDAALRRRLDGKTALWTYGRQAAGSLARILTCRPAGLAADASGHRRWAGGRTGRRDLRSARRPRG